MNKVTSVVIGIALSSATALSAAPITALDVPGSVNQVYPASRALPAGDYLVKFTRSSCKAEEANLAKNYIYEAGNKTINFRVASIVNEPQPIALPFCAWGPQTSAVARVSSTTPFTLTSEQGLGIQGVYTFTSLKVLAGEGSLLGKGAYVVDTAAKSYCAVNEFYAAKSTKYVGMGITAQTFGWAGVAYSNLAQVAVCWMNPPDSRGAAYLRATGPSTRLNLDHTTAENLSVREIRMVTSVTPVN